MSLTTPAIRFWRFVDKAEGCWEWSGPRFPTGYGFLKDSSTKRNRMAHRVSWEIHYGPIPKGLHCCHRCDNRSCVNPAHLFIGTAKDNMVDRDRKGRQAPHHGEFNGRAKLTEAVRLEIIREYSSGGVSYDKLAKKHRVSKTGIANLLRGKSWKHQEPARGIKAIRAHNDATKGLPGETNPFAKLSADDVRHIRSDYMMGGVTLQQLAARFAVNKTCIHKIIKRESWRHVE